MNKDRINTLLKEIHQIDVLKAALEAKRSHIREKLLEEFKGFPKDKYTFKHGTVDMINRKQLSRTLMEKDGLDVSKYLIEYEQVYIKSRWKEYVKDKNLLYIPIIELMKEVEVLRTTDCFPDLTRKTDPWDIEQGF